MILIASLLVSLASHAFPEDMRFQSIQGNCYVEVTQVRDQNLNFITFTDKNGREKTVEAKIGQMVRGGDQDYIEYYKENLLSATFYRIDFIDRSHTRANFSVRKGDKISLLCKNMQKI